MRPKHILILAMPALAAPGIALSHEAWLLTPQEIRDLAVAPVPGLFTNPIVMIGAAVAAAIVVAAALFAEDRLADIETRVFAPLAARAGSVGPVLVRLGLALMLGLGALGGLPRSGTAPWTQPVLLVPDMQLGLVPGWAWLAQVELALAALLLVGAFTRIAGIGVIALSALGLVIYGLPFAAYAAHFTAPALVLILCGAGALSLDGMLRLPQGIPLSEALATRLWTVMLALTGATFVYLGVSVKLFQPTLLMAILDHGEVPRFGLPLEVLALVMTGVEICAGALLAFGRLVRPVALFLLFAFTFFAVTIGETPLFHANLYGLALMLVMTGRDLPPSPQRGTAPVPATA